MDKDNLTENLVKQLLMNQRKDRRWKNIRFFVGWILIIVVVLSYYNGLQAIFGESYTLKATVPEGAFFVKWNTHRYDDVNSGIYPNSQPNTIPNSPNTSFNNTFVKNMLIVPICNTN